MVDYYSQKVGVSEEVMGSWGIKYRKIDDKEQLNLIGNFILFKLFYYVANYLINNYQKRKF